MHQAFENTKLVRFLVESTPVFVRAFCTSTECTSRCFCKICVAGLGTN